MPHLTSLKVVGGTGAVLDAAKDLPTAAQRLTALRSLSYTGQHCVRLCSCTCVNIQQHPVLHRACMLAGCVGAFT